MSVISARYAAVIILISTILVSGCGLVGFGQGLALSMANPDFSQAHETPDPGLEITYAKSADTAPVELTFTYSKSNEKVKINKWLVMIRKYTKVEGANDLFEDLVYETVLARQTSYTYTFQEPGIYKVSVFAYCKYKGYPYRESEYVDLVLSPSPGEGS